MLEPFIEFERLIIAGDFRAQCVLANAGSEHTPLRGVVRFGLPLSSQKQNPPTWQVPSAGFEGHRGLLTCPSRIMHRASGQIQATYYKPAEDAGCTGGSRSHISFAPATATNQPGQLRWPLHTSLSAMSRYGFAYLLAAFPFALMLRDNVLVDELGWESLRKPVGQSASSTTGGRSIKPWILSFLFCSLPAY